MAERYAVANGDSNDVATWDGGTTLPGASDDVFLNNYVVELAADFTCANLSNAAGTTAVAGGHFTMTTDGVTLTVTGTISCTTDESPVQVDINTAEDASIVAGTLDATGLSVNYNAPIHLVTGCAGTVNATYDLISANSPYIPGVLAYGATASVNLVGDLPDNGFSSNSATLGAVTVTGDVTGSASYAMWIYYGAASITVVGGVTAGAQQAIYTRTVATPVEVTGNGVTTDESLIFANNGGNITWTGNITSTSSSDFVIYTNGYTVDITGHVDLAGHDHTFGIAANTTGTIRLAGNLTVGPGCPVPLYAGTVYLDNVGAIEWTFLKSDGVTERKLYSVEAFDGYPAEADVRDGTLFGPSNEYEGTMSTTTVEVVERDSPVIMIGQ